MPVGLTTPIGNISGLALFGNAQDPDAVTVLQTTAVTKTKCAQQLAWKCLCVRGRSEDAIGARDFHRSRRSEDAEKSIGPYVTENGPHLCTVLSWSWADFLNFLSYSEKL